jgi:hypothetical protein
MGRAVARGAHKDAPLARSRSPAALEGHGGQQGRRLQRSYHSILQAFLLGAWQEEYEDDGRQELWFCTSEDGVSEPDELPGGGEKREDGEHAADEKMQYRTDDLKEERSVRHLTKLVGVLLLFFFLVG